MPSQAIKHFYTVCVKITQSYTLKLKLTYTYTKEWMAYSHIHPINYNAVHIFLKTETTTNGHYSSHRLCVGKYFHCIIKNSVLKKFLYRVMIKINFAKNSLKVFSQMFFPFLINDRFDWCTLGGTKLDSDLYLITVKKKG